MARIYSHKKGKAGSTHPVRTGIQPWVRYAPDEITKIIVKLQKEGFGSSKIGLLLRDQYGVPSVKLLTGKSLNTLLEENGSAPQYPEDLFNLMGKAVRIRKHLISRAKDEHSLHGLHNTEMKILRLVKYYKRTGVLPETWQYNPETAAIIVSGGAVTAASAAAKKGTSNKQEVK